MIYNGVVDNGPGGYGYSTVQAYWQSISPLHNITATAPPTVFFLGTSDALIPVSVGQNYKSAMEAVGRRCDLHLYQNQPHSFFNFDVPTDSSGPFYGYRDTLFKTDEFLVSLGYLADPHDAPVPATGWVTLSGDAAFSAGSAATASPLSLDLSSHLGNASNKIILAGGGLISLTAASAATTTFSLGRDIEVPANSAIGSWAGNSGTNRTVVVDLAAGKTISGNANLTRYLSTTSIGSGNKEEVRLSGGMSGFTGTYENHGGVTVIQTTTTSAGTWKSTGGTLKLNTTSNTHIADGPGKRDLLMNGGTLDMNGKSETINGLSGYHIYLPARPACTHTASPSSGTRSTRSTSPSISGSATTSAT